MTKRIPEPEPRICRKVKVLCSYVIEVEVWDQLDPFFYVEDNGCPGTGEMGAVLDRVMEEADEKGVCWACWPLQGKCKVLEIDGVPADEWRKGCTNPSS